MSDVARLRVALEAVEGARTFNLTDGKKGRAIVEAARERLAQLETETIVISREDGNWPEEVVKAAKAAIFSMSMVDRYDEGLVAVAVLGALADSFKQGCR